MPGMPGSELEEALTAAGVPQLIQKVIDPLMLEYQRRMAPAVRVIPTKKINSPTYYFNRRTSRAPGGFVTDGGARPVGQSTYEQFSFAIKLLQAQGAVTGFAEEVTADQIGDLRASEISGAMQGLLWDIEHAMFWGNSAATQLGPWPQFDGLDTMVSQFASTPGAPQNAVDVGGQQLSLRHLDLAIDQVQTAAAQPMLADSYMFMATPTAISKIAQLETPLQRFITQGDLVNVGLNVSAYRNVPLIPTSFLGSQLTLPMSTVVASAAATGGTLPAGQYFYRVEAVMSRAGTSVPSAEVSQTVSGSTSAITLGFTPPVGPEQSGPMTYRVYRSGTSGAETLLGVVDAVVALAGDGITPIYATGITDTGSRLVPTAATGTIQPANSPATYVGGGSCTPRIAGGEDIYLVPRDPDILLRPYVRDIKPVAVYPTQQAPDLLPFALLTDTCLALRAPKYVSRVRNVVSQL